MIQEKLELDGVEREGIALLGLLKREVLKVGWPQWILAWILRFLGDQDNDWHQGLWGPLRTAAIKRALSIRVTLESLKVKKC